MEEKSISGPELAQKMSEKMVTGEVPDERLVEEAVAVLTQLEGLIREMDQLRGRMAGASGLNLPSYGLLTLAAQSSDHGTTVSEAASHLGVRPQALSSAASKLVQEGLLTRKVDAKDGRARRMHITEAGMERLEPSRRIRERVARQVLAQVPHPSVARLVLTRMESALTRGRSQTRAVDRPRV